MIAYVREETKYQPFGPNRGMRQSRLVDWEGTVLGSCVLTVHPWGYKGDPNNRLITWTGELADGRRCYGRLTENSTATRVHFYGRQEA